MINEKKKNRKGLTFRTSIPLENRRVGMDSKFRRKKICIVDYFTNGREREREKIEIGLRWKCGIYLEIGVQEDFKRK